MYKPPIYVSSSSHCHWSYTTKKEGRKCYGSIVETLSLDWLLLEKPTEGHYMKLALVSPMALQTCPKVHRANQEFWESLTTSFHAKEEVFRREQYGQERETLYSTISFFNDCFSHFAWSLDNRGWTIFFFPLMESTGGKNYQKIIF